MNDGSGSDRPFRTLLPRVPRMLEQAVRLLLGGAIAGQGILAGASADATSERDASGSPSNTLIVGRERKTPGLVLKLKERAGLVHAQFASHKSHSSHASHASHASHYSSSSGSAADQRTPPAPPSRPAAATDSQTVKRVSAAARTITVSNAQGALIEYALRDDTMIQLGSASAVRIDDYQVQHPAELPVRAGQRVQVQSRESADHKNIAIRIVVAEQPK